MDTVDVRELALRQLHSWSGFRDILEAMTRAPSIKLYLTGGTLRNIYAGANVPSKDFDFFIQGSGENDFFAYLSECGRLSKGPFGSPRWSSAIDKDFYCDLIPIKRFNNGLWQCEDIIDALNQFDFTANAIAMDIECGMFFDPQNGIRDAKERVLRAVRFDYPDQQISPNTRLTRNSILWMRLNHYAVKLTFELEPVTLQWLRTNIRYHRDISEFTSVFFSPLINKNLYQSLY